MKSTVCLALTAGLLSLLAPAATSAQVTLSAAAGATFPTGGYGDLAKTGWLAHGGVSVPLGTAPVSVGVDGFFGSNSHDTGVAGVSDGDKTNLYGAAGSVSYVVGDPAGPVVPVVFGLLGFMTHSFKSDVSPEGSNTSFAAGGGAGIGFPLGSVGGTLEGWWVTGFSDNKDTKIIGVDLGVRIPLGGGM